MKSFTMISVSQWPNLETLVWAAKGNWTYRRPVETVCFRRRRRMCDDKQARMLVRECWGCSNAETTRGKGCADPRSWQQIGVGRAYMWQL